VFKKEMGMTFSDYVAEYRMNIAKEWLETTTMRLAEIAERLNYSNTTAFIRIFRKVVGMTPGQYREQFHKD
jgi:AraC-like DNA-binding protein